MIRNPIDHIRKTFYVCEINIMKAFYLDLYGSSKGKLLPTIFISDYRFMLGYFIILFFFRKNSLKAVK